jgi:hypothetical protein
MGVKLRFFIVPASWFGSNSLHVILRERLASPMFTLLSTIPNIFFSTFWDFIPDPAKSKFLPRCLLPRNGSRKLIDSNYSEKPKKLKKFEKPYLPKKKYLGRS